MAFNVENLFDTEHDQGKLDYTFLPLEEKRKSKEANKYCDTLGSPKWKEECLYLDWTPSTLHQKMKNIADAVLQVNDGKGPDILVLAEVENMNVLNEWVQKYLGKADYKTINLKEGMDERGIDVAIVSRLEPMGEPILYPIAFGKITSKERMDTRGILEATFQLPDSGKLTIYANHFPAPYHKKEYRIMAYRHLSELMKRKKSNAMQIAAGDFNTPGTEDRKNQILKTYVEPDWIIAHQVGYKGSQGSTYYGKDKTWSFLDMILLSKNLSDGNDWDWNPESFKIADQFRGQLNDAKTPQSFDPRTGLGVSDHLPLFIEIQKH